MDTCVICFEDMDMVSFEDQRENTETCIKLECGHAYHTRCIVRCLSLLNQKCPNCNTTKTPTKELTREGLARKLVSEIKKDDDMKFLLTEYKEVRKELMEAQTQLKKDVKEFINKRKAELCFDEKRTYFINCSARIQSTARATAKAKGPQYVGALSPDRTGRHYWFGAYFDRIMYGNAQARLDYRLKFPYIRMRGW